MEWDDDHKIDHTMCQTNIYANHLPIYSFMFDIKMYFVFFFSLRKCNLNFIYHAAYTELKIEVGQICIQ